MELPIEGLQVGHRTNEHARTGMTVILFPEGTVASGEVRGGAPATREFDLLDPVSTVDRLDALVLAGGSAFGLAAMETCGSASGPSAARSVSPKGTCLHRKAGRRP